MNTWTCDGTHTGEDYFAHDPVKNNTDYCQICGLAKPDSYSSENTFNNDDTQILSETELVTESQEKRKYKPLILGCLLLIATFLSLGFLATKLLFPSPSPIPEDPEITESPKPDHLNSSPTPSPSTQPIINPINVTLVPYQSSQHGIKINYPDNWERQEQYMITTGELVTFFVPKNNTGQFREKVIISVVDLSHHPHPLSLDEYSQIATTTIQNKTNNHLIQAIPTTLAYRKAKTITYTSNVEGYAVEIQETWTVYNDKAYVITHIVENKSTSHWQLTVENMIKSFEVQ